MPVPRAIAVAQSVPRPGDVAANVAEHLRLTELAVARGARVVVFPELSLTGYELGLAASLAFGEEDPRLAPLARAARSLGAWLVVGAPVRLEGGLRIGAFLLAPDGAMELTTKRRLGAFSPAVAPDGVVPPPEASVFAPGECDALVRFDGHLAAVAVCADTGDPAHAATARDRGAASYLASMFFPPAEEAGERAKLAATAARLSLVVAMANFGGPSGGLPSAGGSTIWSAAGDEIVRLPAAGAGVAVAREEGAGWRAERVELGTAGAR